ncbi:hypothetical protein AB835_12265 [Candidatus Endobugula sertula]|uniref:OmpA-like domain-containing protein n=1 Tax=Candidatus Endobugula sertula TaxID=62101 RepID=A0A1D2QMJ9_9GAMM|nr:hypothetical protein AB835_12265 [Candidatus Endobugula sertula]
MSRQNGSISLVVILLLSIGVIASGYFLYDSYDQRETLTSKLDKTTKRLRRTEQRLREKESSLSEQESKVYNLSNQETRLKQEVETIKKQLSQTQQSMQQTEQMLTKVTSEFQSKLQDKESQYSKLTNTFNKKANAYEKELDQLNAISSKLNQKYQTAQEALDNERLRTEEFASAISVLEKDVAHKQESLQQSKQQLALERSRSQTYTSTIKTLEQDIHKGQEALDIAKEQLDTERSRSEAYTLKIEGLKQRLKKEQQALANLKKQLNELNQMNKQLSANNQQLHSEKNRLVKQFRDGTTIIRLEDSVLFPLGSAELNERGKKILSAVANTLHSFPNHRISIEGHTDSKPITSALSKKYPSNWELSAARASGAIRFLTKQGLSSNQFQAVCFANTRPISNQNDHTGRNKNRRIEIFLYPPSEKFTIEVYKHSMTNKLSSNH